MNKSKKKIRGPCLLLYHRPMLSGERGALKAGWWGPPVCITYDALVGWAPGPGLITDPPQRLFSHQFFILGALDANRRPTVAVRMLDKEPSLLTVAINNRFVR